MAPDTRTNLDGDIELLSQVPLFAEMKPDQLRLLAFSLSRRDLRPGEVLFRKGERAESGFVVIFGTIELSTGEGAARKVLQTCHRGYLIGELALFIETRRPADATAANMTAVIEIGRPVMTRLLTEFPDIAASMQQRMARRVGGTIAELRRVRATLLAIGGGG